MNIYFYIITAWVVIGIFNFHYCYDKNKIDELQEFYSKNVIVTIYFLMNIILAPLVLFIDTIPDLIKRKVNKLLKKKQLPKI